MGKSRDKNENEHLRGIIREQKSLIKHLKKQLKNCNKNQHNYEELQEALEHEQQVEVSLATVLCPSCSKGSLVRENLGVRTVVKCNNRCGYSKFEKTKS